ncbi:thioredoxin-like domain-containing protein [Telluribacter sp.]|jgi:thiol-disulfide isomerase/thioredoxin|uniref:thioredoxin-like domain-containing protein n=1 Tax=Telluribacter sp. TaxID=1978767 RepID=UPI002E0F4999|nr:thioredoxin-like domain-containing protein [Telluribacter sp.]
MKKGFTGGVILTALLLGTGWSASAQGYRIEATLTGLKDTSCILGHYSYSNKQFFAKDTARADASGRMVFEGNTPLPGGLYLVLLPGQRRWVELVYSGQETRFSFQTDTSNIVKNMVVKGSQENQLFYTYQNELRRIMEGVESLNREKAAGGANAAASDQKIADAQKQFTDYQRKFLIDNAGTFTGKLLKASIEPEIPPAPKLPNGKSDSVWVFNYYKAHYWDGFDFSDDRLLRTPFMLPKLERYMKELVVQVPDSIIRDADALIKKAAANKDMKSYIIFYVTSEYENAKIVGTEGVFVHMAEKYYLSGEMGVSEDGRRRIAERVNSMKPLLVNKIIPNLTISDTLRKPLSIHGIKADYTVLFFYSPTCGHCKEAAPKLKEFYDKNKATGVKVLAIATEQSPEEWKKYISTYKLGELLHGYDYANQTDYRTQYDVFSTPTIYVLDKNKKIIARRMPIEQLDDFYNFYRKNKEATATPAKTATTGVSKSGK